MTVHAITAHAAALADKTADAYSFDAYGPERWRACCAMLIRRGYDDEQIEAILRSKWTRWAGDMASDRHRYGQFNSVDLARFLDSMPPHQRSIEVEELVAGTFHNR